MRNLTLILLLGLAVQAAHGQKYFSKTGTVTFLSNAPLEKIEARNTTASTVIDASNGNMEWAVLIQAFQFEKALMQDHFNENYMESGKFPKAKFKGKIDNWSTVNLGKDGIYPVTASGTLEIHGVNKPVTAQGKITVKNKVVSAQSKFNIMVADYGIQIPKVVADNVAKQVEIEVLADYQLMQSTP